MNTPGHSPPDEGVLRDALDRANIPTLLVVLAHLTGDPKWLGEKYRPTRTVALDDNDTGGLSEERQREIRDAVGEVVLDIHRGRLPLAPPPKGDRLIDLLSFSLGEQVPPEYAESMEEEAGFRDRLADGWTDDRPRRADETNVLIIGAGLSGIVAAVQMQRLGIPYTVIERNEDVGGVWFDNDYPGAGSDTPIHLYSFSFAPRPLWSRYYARQPEIRAYVRRTADEQGVLPHIRFGEEVTRMRWDEQTGTWQVSTRRDDDTRHVHEATAVISCAGILNQPRIPDLPGMDEFAGPMFHSSRWQHDVDLDGRRVAVIGTGATSMQIVPAIVDRAEQVSVFQRSPQWVVPNPNYLRDVDREVQEVMAHVPYYLSIYRLRLTWMSQDKLLPSLRRDPDWPDQHLSINATNDRHRRFLTSYIDDQLGERTDLREKVLPDYPPYGKRMLMDNRWYETVKREDVNLVAKTVTGFDDQHVLTEDGERHPADVVVLATGFHSARMLYPMDVQGRDGQSLRELWGDEDPYAYLGITVPGFPNFFLLGGPNTQLGHGGSAIFVSECAANYVGKMLVRMIEGDLASVEVREDATRDYNRRVEQEHEQLIWTHPRGVRNWFRNSAGRVVTVTPWRGVDYWEMTREPDLNDYVVTARAASTL